MVARWSFEALAVEQFKNNRYGKLFFPYEMDVSRNTWYASYLLPILKDDLQECSLAGSVDERVKNNFQKLSFYMGEKR